MLTRWGRDKNLRLQNWMPLKGKGIRNVSCKEKSRTLIWKKRRKKLEKDPGWVKRTVMLHPEEWDGNEILHDGVG